MGTEGAPDEAVANVGPRGARPLNLEGLPEPRHVDVEAPHDAAGAQAQRRGVAAHVVARLAQRPLALDEDAPAHVDGLPAECLRLTPPTKYHSIRHGLRAVMKRLASARCACAGSRLGKEPMWHFMQPELSQAESACRSGARAPQAVVDALPQRDDVAVPGCSHGGMQGAEAQAPAHCTHMHG